MVELATKSHIRGWDIVDAVNSFDALRSPDNRGDRRVDCHYGQIEGLHPRAAGPHRQLPIAPNPERLHQLHRVNIARAEAFRKVEMAEIVSHSRRGVAAGSIRHIRTRAVTGDAVQCARSPAYEESVRAEVEREPGGFLVG